MKFEENIIIMKEVTYYCDYCDNNIESTLTKNNIKVRKDSARFGTSTSSIEVCNDCPPQEVMMFMTKFSFGVRVGKDNEVRFLFDHTAGPSNQKIPEETSGYDVVYEYIEKLVDKYYN